MTLLHGLKALLASKPPPFILGSDRPPATSRFFGKTPQAREARSLYLRMFGGGSGGIILMVFLILPIYWGALWKSPVRHLPGWVVDMDGGVVGQQISQALVANMGGGRVTWEARAADSFDGGIDGIRRAIKEHETWVLVAIMPETSSRLQASILAPNAAYNGSQALVAYASEARNENIFRTLIRPTIDATLSAASRSVALSVAARAGALPQAALGALMATSPQTVVAPVWYTLENLVPFDQPVATAATFVGMLYYLLMGFFVTMAAYMAREFTGLDRSLPVKSLIILRLSCVFVAYFFLSLFYSLLNLAFQLDLTRTFGIGGFWIFWMVNYLGMLAMCMALESMITWMGPKAIAFFLLLWIISNLSVSILPIEVLPGIFRYGYAFPFYNISKGIRTIVFGTKNELGMVVGILIAWIALSCLTMAFFQWLVHPIRSERAGADNGDDKYEESDTYAEYNLDNGDAEKRGGRDGESSAKDGDGERTTVTAASSINVNDNTLIH